MKSLTRKARFILSFDCEGKWGMADHPEMASSNPISRDSLANAYTQIFQILEKHNIPATFALVGLFAGAYEQYVDSRGDLLESEPHRNWLQVPERSFAAGLHDGWFYPELVDQIKSILTNCNIEHGVRCSLSHRVAIDDSLQCGNGIFAVTFSEVATA